jgi:hypothetical protein
MGIKHPFPSAKTDASDPTKVRPSSWNADHVIDGDVNFNNFSATNVNQALVADDPYNATSWDANLSVPTKNAIRDKIESLIISGGGVTDFLNLTDTPDNYAGNANKFVAVNSGANALQFTSTIAAARGPTLQIAAGVITVTSSFHYVDTEASAAFDQLDTINGGVDGQRLTLRIANATRRVWLSNDGNIFAGGAGEKGYLLSGTAPVIELMFDDSLNRWHEVSRSQGHNAYQGYRNVKDYGAIGDGVADDTAAIQRAIDDTLQSSLGIAFNEMAGIVWFPSGRYRVTSSINIGASNSRSIRLQAENGALIEGSFAGPLLSRPKTGGTSYAQFAVDGINFSQGNASGSCLTIGDNICGTVSNCRFGTSAAATLVKVGSDQTFFHSCGFKGNFAATGGGSSGAIGLMGGSLSVIGCSFQALGIGIKCYGFPALSAISNRFEVNGIGIQAGGDFTDPFFGGSSSENAQGVQIHGGHGESNNKHFYAINVGTLNITGWAMASFNAGNTHGIHIQIGRGVTIVNTFCSGGYSVAAIKLEQLGAASFQFHCRNVTASNTSGTAWDVDDDIDTTNWVDTNYDGAWVHRYLDHGYINGTTTIAGITATIASGAVTVTGNYMIIDTEGLAATDNLDTLGGSTSIVRANHGGRLILRAANSARTVVVRDGIGNIHLAGSDCTLDNVRDTLELIWDGLLSEWLEVGRSDNGP